MSGHQSSYDRSYHGSCGPQPRVVAAKDTTIIPRDQKGASPLEKATSLKLERAASLKLEKAVEKEVDQMVAESAPRAAAYNSRLARARAANKANNRLLKRGSEVGLARHAHKHAPIRPQ